MVVICTHKVNLAELVHDPGNLLYDIGSGMLFIEGAEAEMKRFSEFSFVVKKVTRNTNEWVPTRPWWDDIGWNLLGSLPSQSLTTATVDKPINVDVNVIILMT